MTEVHQLNFGAITVHAWNADRTQIAVCPNSNQVLIYQKTHQGFQLLHTLSEHDKLVTGIDWAPNTNRIATCSQDRNAYVWKLDLATNSWKPTLVLLRINRAATSIQWSPNEDKFAVGSGARLIAVCYFDEDNDWWVSKHIKKPIRSTVLGINWHPDNILLAAGSSDMKSRVFSAFIKGVDKKAGNPVWGDKLPLGTVCGEFGSNYAGWVHATAFSPSGNTVAWVSHDSTLGVASPAQNYIASIKTPILPLTCLLFLSETQIVAAGYDCVPYLFEQRPEGWQLVRKLDQGNKKESVDGSAKNMFRQMDSRAQFSNEDTELPSIHQNTITCIRPWTQSGGAVTKFSTTGLDGKLVIWDVLSLGISQMRI